MKKFKSILVLVPFFLISSFSLAQKTTKENLLEKKEKNLDSVILNKQYKGQSTLASSSTRTVGTVTNIEPAVIMGQNNFLTGNSASNFTENLRNTSNGTDWAFGNINLSDFTGNTNITGVVGGYNLALKSGSGEAQSVYANLLGARNSGAGNTDFLVGAVIQVNALGSGTVNYARSTSSTLTVDDTNVTVNFAQAMHPTLSLKNGTINNAANILYLDYDIENTMTFTGDLSYIEAGEDNLTNFTTGGEKRFIYYRGNLKSDFNGIINVNKTITDLDNATDKVLVTKEYIKNEFTLGKNQSPWDNTNATNASQNSTDINYLNGNVGIGTTNTQGFKLGVNGNIAALDVKIDTYANWPDFVFKKEYNLPKLNQVEKYIEKNGHLENIPSAKKVKQDGFYLAKMNAKLLQKVEELTLYIINQDKRIKALEEKMENKKRN
ncbi:MAG: hypothetical protein AB8B78_10790 [Polaribacter sp.]